MPKSNYLINIEPLFSIQAEESNQLLYQKIIRNNLQKILPSNLHKPASHDTDRLDDQKQAFSASLPILKISPLEETPSAISFYMLSKCRQNAHKFFFDLISNWLIPGKQLEALLFYGVDFCLPDYGDDVLTLCEAKLKIEDEADLEILQRNLPIVETELRMGMQSAYHARRILEIKGLSADAKTVMIQEYIAFLMGRLTKHFDHNILTEMQHILVICREEFKAVRDCRHLSRIISVHYLFRKYLHEAVRKDPDKRHLSLKIHKSCIRLPTGQKPVLSIMVGINFLQETEIFEERHLISAIQNYIPTAKAVENSFFSNRRGKESICTLYLELEKSGGEEFTADEIRLLRNELPTDLKDRIEHLMHPIFMPRNDEEIMRNILSLCDQIKYLHDLPQMIISFDKQTHTDLLFNVIMVEIKQPCKPSVQERFKQANSFLEYIHDRSRTVGVLRKKYPKEASVYSVKLSKTPFLRADHSINLNNARQAVASELSRVLGEIRDFNGGMISKQHETLCAVRDKLCDVKYNELLLENFFYSLTPDVARTVGEPDVLKTLFTLLLTSINDGFFSGEKHALKFQCDSRYVYAIVKSEDKAVKENLSRMVHRFDQQPSRMANSFVIVYDIAYVGYLFMCDDKAQQKAFCTTLQNSIVKGQK